jgi:hypothetical protein
LGCWSSNGVREPLVKGNGYWGSRRLIIFRGIEVVSRVGLVGTTWRKKVEI